jgi:hypothetical protein
MSSPREQGTEDILQEAWSSFKREWGAPFLGGGVLGAGAAATFFVVTAGGTWRFVRTTKPYLPCCCEGFLELVSIFSRPCSAR